jgi:hypothetical protein
MRSRKGIGNAGHQEVAGLRPGDHVRLEQLEARGRPGFDVVLPSAVDLPALSSIAFPCATLWLPDQGSNLEHPD